MRNLLPFYTRTPLNSVNSSKAPDEFGNLPQLFSQSAVPVLRPYAPLRENMTSVTQPEVHNELHCRHRKTEPRPQVIHTENFAKFG